MMSGQAVGQPLRHEPSVAEDLGCQPPEKLVEDILAKEQRIMEIMGEIKAVLRTKRRL